MIFTAREQAKIESFIAVGAPKKKLLMPAKKGYSIARQRPGYDGPVLYRVEFKRYYIRTVSCEKVARALHLKCVDLINDGVYSSIKALYENRNLISIN